MKVKFFCVALMTLSLNAVAQIADENCKFLGNIIASSTPTDFLTYWNQVTPENAGKWGSVEVTRDVMNWTALDNAYNLARNNSLPFKQHTFVWGQQEPQWLAGISAAEQKAEVEEWIQDFCTRYPETHFIDVVNEPLHAAPSYKTALGGNGTTGWDWVIWSFEKAREYCPNAKLFLNDYNIVSSASATTAYIGIINLLKSKNLIDGIGEQGHFLETTPLATIEENLNKLAALELPIHISEFDIHLASDADQKNKYEELFPVLWSHPGVKGITLWGYKQGQIWRENAYLIRSNGTDRPAFVWLKDYIGSTTGESFCAPIVATEETENSAFNVYPNPSRGQLAIFVPIGRYRLSVIDITGKVFEPVRSVSYGKHEIQLKAPPGLYFIKLSNQNSDWLKKVIVR